MAHPRYARWLAICLAVPLLALASAASAADAPDHAHLVSHIYEQVSLYKLWPDLLDATSKLFWGLATMSLVWTMGTHVVRQDMGEMLMELLRFIIVTGTFYWLLINASGDSGEDGFVAKIVQTFLRLPNDAIGDGALRGNADGILNHGLNVFFNVVDETSDGDIPDRIAALAIASTVLVLLACLAAQFLVALVMAWMLGFAGIFLLGFGGARWTAPVAISYYKHVVAVGAAILTLSILGSVGASLLGSLHQGGSRSAGVNSMAEYRYLGVVLASSVLMLVLGIRVPQIFYTLVTGSPLSLFAGTATAAGAAFASGGAAMAAAMQRGPDGGGRSPDATGTLMGAVGGAQAAAAMSAGAGMDPFGVPRQADPLRHGNAFGRATTAATPLSDGDVSRVAAQTPDLGDVPVSGTSESARRRPDYEAEITEAASSWSAHGGAAKQSRQGAAGSSGDVDQVADDAAAEASLHTGHTPHGSAHVAQAHASSDDHIQPSNRAEVTQVGGSSVHADMTRFESVPGATGSDSSTDVGEMVTDGSTTLSSETTRTRHEADRVATSTKDDTLHSSRTTLHASAMESATVGDVEHIHPSHPSEATQVDGAAVHADASRVDAVETANVRGLSSDAPHMMDGDDAMHASDAIRMQQDVTHPATAALQGAEVTQADGSSVHAEMGSATVGDVDHIQPSHRPETMHVDRSSVHDDASRVEAVPSATVRDASPDVMTRNDDGTATPTSSDALSPDDIEHSNAMVRPEITVTQVGETMDARAMASNAQPASASMAAPNERASQHVVDQPRADTAHGEAPQAHSVIGNTEAAPGLAASFDGKEHGKAAKNALASDMDEPVLGVAAPAPGTDTTTMPPESEPTEQEANPPRRRRRRKTPPANATSLPPTDITPDLAPNEDVPPSNEEP